MLRPSKALTDALSTKNMRTPAKSLDNASAKTPEEIFAEAFRKSVPADISSNDDKALNSIIEEIASQL